MLGDLQYLLLLDGRVGYEKLELETLINRGHKWLLDWQHRVRELTTQVTLKMTRISNIIQM